MYSRDSKNNFSRFIKNRISLIIFLIILMILFLFGIILYAFHAEAEQSSLIKVLSRQQLLTQLISKNADLKNSLIKDMKINKSDPDVGGIRKDAYIIDESLQKYKEEYGNTIESLHNGIIIDGDKIINIDRLLNSIDFSFYMEMFRFDDFNSAVDVIINSYAINDLFEESVYFIDTYNEDILDNWVALTQQLIKKQNGFFTFFLIIVFVIYLILFMFLFLLIKEFYKYVIEPINEFYKGIDNFGITKNDFNVSVVSNKTLAPVIHDIKISFYKLNRLLELIENLNKNISFEDLLDYIYNNFSEFIPYSHIGIALLKDNGKVLEASYGISAPSINDLPKKLVGIRAKLSDTSLGNIVNNGIPRVINDLEKYTQNSTAIYNKILIEAGIKSSISLPLKINGKPVGVIFFSSIYSNIYKPEHIKFLKTLSSSISIGFNKSIFIDELLYSTLLALTKMAEERDEETGDHLERIKKYSLKIAESLLEENVYENQITYGFLKDIERFSPMHDIGKVGIRDSILLKHGKLSEEEFEEMKKHTVYGADVLRIAEKNIVKYNKSMFTMGIQIAESHQEKWDGTGYPYQLSGTDIPLSARIVAVADVFDALTSQRPYKKAFSFRESFDMVVKERGKHFDPKIIDVFIKHRDDIFQIYKGFTDNIMD